MSNEIITREYNSYSDSYNNLLQKLKDIVENKEITQEDKYDLEEGYEDYSNNLESVKKVLNLENKKIEIYKEKKKYTINRDDVLNILTENGKKTFIYTDDEGNILFDGNSIPDLNVIKLNVDEQNKIIETLISEGYVEVDGENIKLNVAYSQLIQTVDGIDTIVTELTTDIDNNYSTTEQMQSAISQKADEIKLMVQSNSESIKTTLTSTYNEFYLSTSNTELIGGSWSKDTPTSTSNKYIWLRTVTVLKDGTKKEGNAVCIAGGKGEKGDPGVGIEKVETIYFVHTSKTEAPTFAASGWISYIPTYEENRYLWSANKIYYTNGSIKFTNPVYLSEWEANYKAETAISTAKQTAEKFEWLVKKGSTSSSITLTDSLIEAIAASDIKLSAKKILINGLLAGAGWSVTDEGELDITDLNVRGNFSCDSINVDNLISAKIPSALTENKTIHVASGETISQYLDDLPLNLNGFTVNIYLDANTTENLELRRHVNGLINIFFCGHGIKGTIRGIYNNSKYSIYGGSNEDDTTKGFIMPYTSYKVGSYYYSAIFSNCPNVSLYNLKVYGDSINTASSVGIGGTQKSQIYMENISFVGCKYNVRTYSMAQLYCQSSTGLSSSNSWSAGTGSRITLNQTTQAGGGNNTYTSGNGQIISNGVTFCTTSDSGSNTSTITPTTLRCETFKPNYADSYRSSVYNSWEKRGKCRQGSWNDLNCNGCWFYGTQFEEVKGKNITKVTIQVSRSSDIGHSAATYHVFQAHTHSSRPTGMPNYTSCNKSLSLAWGESGTVTITDATVLAGIKNGTIKGFGIKSTYDENHYSALTNGTVKIYYTE